MDINIKNQDFLYRQVQNWVMEQIRLGKMKPGSKLPGERQLATLLQISRATARLALQQLEEAGTINRIPSKGAFVSVNKQKRKLRLVLLFPEANISQERLTYSNWAASNELYRGVMHACGTSNNTVTFQHIPTMSDLSELTKNIVKEYDAALFVGYQLGELKSALRSLQFPHLTLAEDAHYSTNYDRSAICEKAAKYLYSCGCRKIYVLVGDQKSTSSLRKITAFRQFFDIPTQNIVQVSDEEEQCYKNIKSYFADNVTSLPDAFFCASQVIPFALLRLAQERNWKIPDDFMIMGYANNMDIRPTNPTLTHVKIPYFEMGRIGTETLIQNIIEGISIPEKLLIPAELIVGKTTYNINNKLENMGT